MKKFSLIIASLLLISGVVFYSCTKDKENNASGTVEKKGLKSLTDDFNLEVGEVYNFYVKVNEAEVNKTSIVKDASNNIYVSGVILLLEDVNEDLLCENGSVFYVDFPMENIRIVSESKLYLDYSNLTNVWQITLGDRENLKAAPASNCVSAKTRGGNETVECCCETDGQPNSYGHCRIRWQYGPRTAPNSFCGQSLENRKCDDCGGSCKKSVTSSGVTNTVISTAAIILTANNVNIVENLPVIN